MLLAFLVSSIGLAHAEPDTTWSTIPGSAPPSDAPDREDESDRNGERDHGDARDARDARDEEDADDPLDARGSLTREDADVDDVRGDSGFTADAIATEALDDAQVDNPAPASIEASTHAPTWAHGQDSREAALRRHTSWLGRLDISITWRRALSESTAIQRDEVWLVGTWRL